MPRHHIFLPLVALLSMGAAAPFEDTTLLDRQVASHLGADIGEVGGAHAPVDPKLKLKRCASAVEISETNRNAVLLSCPQLGWRIFVPVRLGGNGSGRGGNDNAEPVIQRNQPVTLVVRRSSFSISYGVIAQKSGAVGEFIPVRANRNSKEMMARVSGAGEVELTQ